VNDVEIVHALVDAYAANPRTIIPAVVQAGNDISNQPIVQMSKRFDKAGERTIGIITKPDLINIGAQGRIALLARNEDTTRRLSINDLPLNGRSYHVYTPFQTPSSFVLPDYVPLGLFCRAAEKPRPQPLVFFAFNSLRRAFGACDTDAELPSAARARPKLLRL